MENTGVHPKVTLHGVSHSFASDADADQLPVLADVSFDIFPGEFVCLVGQSGCGKTTLLNMIAGFLQPSSGTVSVDGERVTAPGQSAYMFARDNLLPWRKARANVALAMEVDRARSRWGRDERTARARELLELVGLGDAEAKYPSELSQGMRQRVALARTLAVNTDLWLMDEPFAALDASTRTVMQAEFVRIWEATQKTVVLVTHDLIEAIVLSDRVLTMSPGPGRIKNMHRIDLPRPRQVLELHEAPEFLDLYRTLWHELRTDYEKPAAPMTASRPSMSAS